MVKISQKVHNNYDRLNKVDRVNIICYFPLWWKCISTIVFKVMDLFLRLDHLVDISNLTVILKKFSSNTASRVFVKMRECDTKLHAL